MKIYPAIDLLQGRCVRLHKGDFAAVTSYSNDPIKVGEYFVKAGAQYLHVVDLDGAREGAPRQTGAVAALFSLGLSVQVGGGIRQLAEAKALVSAGADRVVVGSLAVSSPEVTEALFAELGSERVTLALDVREADGMPHVALQGWKEDSKVTLWQTLERYLPRGLTHVLCTDIGRDGTLVGPNLGLYREMRRRYPALKIQASGGVGSLGDLESLKASGLDAVIVGKALYEKRFTLEEALKC